MAKQSIAPGCWCFAWLAGGLPAAIVIGCQSMAAGIAVLVLAILTGVVPMLVSEYLDVDGDWRKLVSDEAFSRDTVRGFKKLPRFLRRVYAVVIWILMILCLLTQGRKSR